MPKKKNKTRKHRLEKRIPETLGHICNCYDETEFWMVCSDCAHMEFCPIHKLRCRKMTKDEVFGDKWIGKTIKKR